MYRSEVLRIWNAQCKALSDPVPPELTPEDEKPPPQAPTPSASGGHATRANSRADSIRRDRSPSAMSRVSTPDPEAGSQAGQDPNAASKVLKIRRMIGGKWQTEVVRDAAVINAYVRQRQRIEDENTATEALVPTDDAAMNASRRKRLEEQIEKMKKNQERRLQRKNAKAAAEGLAIPGGYKKLLNKTETKVSRAAILDPPLLTCVLNHRSFVPTCLSSAQMRALRSNWPHEHKHLLSSISRQCRRRHRRSRYAHFRHRSRSRSRCTRAHPARLNLDAK